MVDVSAIGGLISSFKSISDITQAMITLRDGQMIQAKVIELQGVILSAQQRAMQTHLEQTALLEKVRGLEEEIARFKAWSGEKQRYELKQLYRGPFAYILKQGEEAGEAPHALCTSCYEKGVKSVLQSSGHANVHEHFWHCPSCKTKSLNQWRDMGSLISKTRNPTG